MNISLNTYKMSSVSMGAAAKRTTRAQRTPISEILKPLETRKDAVSIINQFSAYELELQNPLGNHS